jgi:hypothetical protein
MNWYDAPLVVNNHFSCCNSNAAVLCFTGIVLGIGHQTFRNLIVLAYKYFQYIVKFFVTFNCNIDGIESTSILY